MTSCVPAHTARHSASNLLDRSFRLIDLLLATAFTSTRIRSSSGIPSSHCPDCKRASTESPPLTIQAPQPDCFCVPPSPEMIEDKANGKTADVAKGTKGRDSPASVAPQVCRQVRTSNPAVPIGILREVLLVIVRPEARNPTVSTRRRDTRVTCATKTAYQVVMRTPCRYRRAERGRTSNHARK